MFLNVRLSLQLKLRLKHRVLKVILDKFIDVVEEMILKIFKKMKFQDDFSYQLMRKFSEENLILETL